MNHETTNKTNFDDGEELYEEFLSEARGQPTKELKVMQFKFVSGFCTAMYVGTYDKKWRDRAKAANSEIDQIVGLDFWLGFWEGS